MLALLPGSAMAASVAHCTFVPTTTNVEFGSVTVPRDTAIGSTVGNPVTVSVTVSCPAAPSTYVYDLVYSSARSMATSVPNTWTTSIGGLGVRAVNLDWATGVVFSTKGPGTPYYSFAPSYTGQSSPFIRAYRLSFQLIKLVGSFSISGGSISETLVGGFSDYFHTTNGSLQEMNPNGFSALLTDHAALAVSGCSVQTASVAVTLPVVARSALAGVGTTAGAKPFAIDVACPSGITSYVTFTDVNNSANTGSALTPGPGSNAAGVAVQLVMNGTLVQYGPASSAANTNHQMLIGSVSGTRSLSMQARYVATASTVSPGSINSQAVFTMSYQ